MIAALIEYFTDYEYDYKFYAMCNGASFPLYEEIFIYSVFYLDLLIIMASIVFGLTFSALGVALICGAL